MNSRPVEKPLVNLIRPNLEKQSSTKSAVLQSAASSSNQQQQATKPFLVSDVASSNPSIETTSNQQQATNASLVSDVASSNLSSETTSNQQQQQQTTNSPLLSGVTFSNLSSETNSNQQEAMNPPLLPDVTSSNPSGKTISERKALKRTYDSVACLTSVDNNCKVNAIGTDVVSNVHASRSEPIISHQQAPRSPDVIMIDSDSSTDKDNNIPKTIVAPPETSSMKLTGGRRQCRQKVSYTELSLSEESSGDEETTSVSLRKNRSSAKIKFAFSFIFCFYSPVEFYYCHCCKSRLNLIDYLIDNYHNAMLYGR